MTPRLPVSCTGIRRRWHRLHKIFTVWHHFYYFPDTFFFCCPPPRLSCAHARTSSLHIRKAYLHYRLWNAGSPDGLFKVQGKKCEAEGGGALCDNGAWDGGPLPGSPAGLMHISTWSHGRRQETLEEMPKRVCNAISDRCPCGTSIVFADVVGRYRGAFVRSAATSLREKWRFPF